MRAALPVTLITPLVFWACGPSSNGGTMVVDSGVADSGASDGSVRDTGVGFGDANVDDAGFDAGAEDVGFPDSGAPDSGAPCTYPTGATEPMALDQVLTPYSWAAAIAPDGTNSSFDLTNYYCQSNTEAIFFVSSVDW
jgi:hypothetical protein